MSKQKMVRLEDDAKRLAKSEAAKQGQTLTQWLSALIRRATSTKQPKKQ